jgi:mRNA-degrading endonuclease toxin of MazEF toxin-antitoxin module
MLERGCLYWARLDKRRPVLIISPNYRNQYANDVLLIPSTTTIRPRLLPTHVRLHKGEGGIPFVSVLKCEQLNVVSRRDIENTPLGGNLSPSRMGEIAKAVMRAIGATV